MTISKDQSIIMQVAAKIAADLTPKTGDVSANVVAFSEAYDAVCEIILASQGMEMTSPTTSGATVTPINSNAVQEQQVFQQAFPQATEAPSSSGFTVRIKGKQHGPIPEWLNKACAEKGVTEVWDNRDGLTANPKRPWFKSTTSNDAFWEPKRK